MGIDLGRAREDLICAGGKVASAMAGKTVIRGYELYIVEFSGEWNESTLLDAT